jgi:hypothetical protein
MCNLLMGHILTVYEATHRLMFSTFKVRCPNIAFAGTAERENINRTLFCRFYYNMVACWTANDLVKGGAVVFAWMPPNNFVVRCIFHECMKSIKKFRIPLVEVELISSGSEIGCAPSLKINSINRPIFKVFFIILILINYYCKDSWCLVHYFKLLLLRHGNRQRMQISIKNKFSPHCLLRSKFSVRPHVICLEKQFGHGPFILCWISLVRHPTGSSHDHCRGPITQLSFVLR